MSDGYNKAMLLGNLGADPELRFTHGGQAVLNIRLATTESYLDKDKSRKERVDWHSVTVWGKRAEGLAKILRKGSRIFVEGRLQTSSYDKDGVKHYKTEVVANHVALAGGARGSDDSEPAARPAPAAQSSKPAAAPTDDYGYGSGDDIPF